MIDELDLAFDEHAERGRPRHRRGSRGDGGRRGGRSAIAFLMAFVLLALLGGGVYLGFTKVKGFFTAADYKGPGTGEVTVVVPPATTLTDIGNLLVKGDVVKSTKAFTNAAGDNPKSGNIQDGTYRMRKQMAAKDAVTLMLDPKSRIVNGVTIAEGKTALQIYAILAKATGHPVGEFIAAAKDPVALGVPATWFVRGDKRPVAKTIEGFLFPDTYEFPPGVTADGALRLMVQHFLTIAGQIDFENNVRTKLAVSPFEALIVASLAQAEAGTAEDQPKVARVAYNRAYKARMPLQFDVTTNYWLELNGQDAKNSGSLLKAELNDPKNPYTTENAVGLPVGPIDNPGRSSLEGAMNPPKADWLFFVAIDKQGHTAFANTNAEHEANIQKACANGLPLCPK